MYLQLRGTDTMPRDGGGTENIQTSANEAAVKNKIYKHLQRRFSSSLYIHIRYHGFLHIFVFSVKRVKFDFQFLSL